MTSWVYHPVSPPFGPGDAVHSSFSALSLVPAALCPSLCPLESVLWAPCRLLSLVSHPEHLLQWTSASQGPGAVQQLPQSQGEKGHQQFQEPDCIPTTGPCIPGPLPVLPCPVTGVGLCLQVTQEQMLVWTFLLQPAWPRSVTLPQAELGILPTCRVPQVPHVRDASALPAVWGLSLDVPVCRCAVPPLSRRVIGSSSGVTSCSPLPPRSFLLSSSPPCLSVVPGLTLLPARLLLPLHLGLLNERTLLRPRTHTLPLKPNPLRALLSEAHSWDSCPGSAMSCAN